MKWQLLFATLLTIFLAACTNEQQSASNALAENEQHQSEEPQQSAVQKGQTEDIKALVANYSSDKGTTEKASITSTELIVTQEDGSETHYDLPKDEFFVSIAPYINETHPCKDHSLTGCQGELVQKPIDVKIENEKGEVIIHDTYTTLENGFIDIWLPRNEAFIIEMHYDGKSVTDELTTFDEDGTCVTTLQLL